MQNIAFYLFWCCQILGDKPHKFLKINFYYCQENNMF